MLTDTNELLTKIGSEIMQAAPGGWVKVIVEVTGWASSVGGRATAVMEDGSERTFSLYSTTSFAILKLRKAMYKPGTGAWYIARFTVDSSHQLDTEFDYESSPFDEDDFDDDARDILLKDQIKYPRHPEHLPRWHPDAP